MSDLITLRAKVAAGRITMDEMLAILESKEKKIQELEQVKVKQPINTGEDVEGLYQYLDKNCNEEFNVHVIFDFFAFLVEKVKLQTDYTSDPTKINETWGLLPLEDCFKALAVFCRKGTACLPKRQECERNTKVALPQDAEKYVSDLKDGKGLMSEYMVNKLIARVDELSRETIADVEANVDQSLESGELSLADALETKLKLNKIKKGEVVELTPIKSKTVENVLDFDEDGI